MKTWMTGRRTKTQLSSTLAGVLTQLGCIYPVETHTHNIKIEVLFVGWKQNNGIRGVDKRGCWRGENEQTSIIFIYGIP